MSTSPARTPNIDLDTLLMIFETITQQMADLQMGSYIQRDHRPHHVLRACSQVCRLWRETLVASPRLWGRVIDLDMPDMSPMAHVAKGKQWIELILTRAGQETPLWISGRVAIASAEPGVYSRSDSQALFIRLLDSWGRIERFSVVLDGWTIPPPIKAAFLSRAPMLKYFEVDLPGLASALKKQNMFAGYAPLLQVYNAEDIPFKLNSSWLSGIQEMVPMPMELAVQDVLAVLKKTPLIKKIKIHPDSPASLSMDSDKSASSLPSLHLPQLSSISLITTLADCAMFMDNCLSTGKLSAFCVGIQNKYDPDTIEDSIRSLATNLPRFISNYFTSNSPTKIRLMVSATGFEFCDITEHDDKERRFSMDLVDRRNRIPQTGLANILSCFFDSISAAASGSPVNDSLQNNPNSGVFESINDITLYLGSSPYTIFPSLRAMFAVFDRVRDIRIPEQSVHNLYSVLFPPPPDQDTSDEEHHHNHGVLFPELHTVYLTGVNAKYVSENTEKRFGLVDLLSERKKIGYPLVRLDMTLCGQAFYVPDLLKDLVEVSGLEVTWKKRRGDDIKDGYNICTSRLARRCG